MLLSTRQLLFASVGLKYYIHRMKDLALSAPVRLQWCKVACKSLISYSKYAKMNADMNCVAFNV